MSSRKFGCIRFSFRIPKRIVFQFFGNRSFYVPSLLLDLYLPYHQRTPLLTPKSASRVRNLNLDHLLRKSYRKSRLRRRPKVDSDSDESRSRSPTPKKKVKKHKRRSPLRLRRARPRWSQNPNLSLIQTRIPILIKSRRRKMNPR